MYVKGANFEGSCCGVVALNQVVYVFLEKKKTHLITENSAFEWLSYCFVQECMQGVILSKVQSALGLEFGERNSIDPHCTSAI